MAFPSHGHTALTDVPTDSGPPRVARLTGRQHGKFAPKPSVAKLVQFGPLTPAEPGASTPFGWRWLPEQGSNLRHSG